MLSELMSAQQVYNLLKAQDASDARIGPQGPTEAEASVHDGGWVIDLVFNVLHAGTCW